MSTGPLTFKLSRIATGTRNLVENAEEDMLQNHASATNRVLLPYVDIATAWALSRRTAVDTTAIKTLSQFLMMAGTSPEGWQIAADRARCEHGWAVFFPATWEHLHHIVRYFDLIEKNEAPDTPFLEWLVMAGVVTVKAAEATVARFAKPLESGRYVFVLDPEDLMRIKMAAEVRAQLEVDEKAKEETA